MFRRIKEIKALKDLCLLATFYDNTKKLYDVHQVLNLGQMSDLKNIPFLFEQVKGDVGGEFIKLSKINTNFKIN